MFQVLRIIANLSQDITVQLGQIPFVQLKHYANRNDHHFQVSQHKSE